MLSQSGSLTAVANEAMVPHLRVKFDRDYELEPAGAYDQELGTLEQRVLTAGDPAAYVPACYGQVEWMVAAGAFDQYAAIYGAAAGKVDDAENCNYLGVALVAATAVNDQIPVLRLRPGPVMLGNDVVIITNAGGPTDGTSGTGAGFAGPGSLCIDYTNAVVYVNTNTKASPLWTVVGAQTT